MKRVNVPTKQMGRFAGKWVIIDPIKQKIIAVGDELKDVGHLASRSISDKRPSGTVPTAFKVPYKNEGPYILLFKNVK